MSRSERKRIAVAIPTGESHFHRGITRFLKSMPSWDVYLSHSWTQLQFEAWQGDGGIFIFPDKTFAEMIVKKGLPAVNCNSHWSDWPLPTLHEDNYAIGKVAAEYFLNKGFRSFAFYGSIEPYYAQQRWLGFCERVVAAGFGEPAREERFHPSWQDGADEIAAWLSTLAKPLALLTPFDAMGRAICRLCLNRDILVPEEVAIMGVDNEETLCECARVGLSSVDRDAEGIGFEAARLLEQILQGKAPPEQKILIPPKGVVERRSTDMLALGDVDLAQAITAMRDRYDDVALSVEDIAAEAGVSRRALELKFQERLHRSPREELIRLRMERAKDLLRETDLSLPRIAEAIGVNGAPYLCRRFKKVVGLTCVEYRRQHRHT